MSFVLFCSSFRSHLANYLPGFSRQGGNLKIIKKVLIIIVCPSEWSFPSFHKWEGINDDGIKAFLWLALPVVNGSILENFPDSIDPETDGSSCFQQG